MIVGFIWRGKSGGNAGVPVEARMAGDVVVAGRG